MMNEQDLNCEMSGSEFKILLIKKLMGGQEAAVRTPWLEPDHDHAVSMRPDVRSYVTVRLRDACKC